MLHDRVNPYFMIVSGLRATNVEASDIGCVHIDRHCGGLRVLLTKRYSRATLIVFSHMGYVLLRLVVELFIQGDFLGHQFISCGIHS